MASKFLEHFLYIAEAMNHLGERWHGLWDEEDGFFYDVLHLPDGEPHAAEGALDGRADSAVRGGDARAASCSISLPGFQRRMEWFIENRPDLTQQRRVHGKSPGKGERRLLSIVDRRTSCAAC